jgi:4-amino-4-deoxy-L-arabinose transferase-like glycosyltransferase
MRSCASAAPDGAATPLRARATLWVVLGLSLLALAFQGTRGIFEQDESRYAGIALQMLDSGQWWIPEFNAGQPHIAKPPLTYWCVAASMALLGRNSWAARLPSALAFVLTGLLVLALARTLGAARPERAVLAWASMLAPFVGANLVMPDPLLALFETLAVLGFARSGLVQGERAERRWLRVLWLGLGLAFLAKGTPALLPLLACALWLGWQRRWRALGALFVPEGVLLFVVLGLGWYIGVVVAHPQWLGYFLGRELAGRMFTATHNRNGDWIDVLGVYGPTLLLGSLPWLALLAVRRRDAATHAPAAWLRWWLLVPLTVFALVRSRLPHYLLPLFVPLALLLERRCEWLGAAAQRRLHRFAAAWLIVLLVFKAVASHVEPDDDVGRLARELAPAVARLSRPLQDFAFVDRHGIWGLRLYTGRPVFEAVLPGDPPEQDRMFRPMEPCDAGSARPGRLWLVPAKLRTRFLEVSAGCGLRARPLLVSLRHWVPYELLPAA